MLVDIQGRVDSTRRSSKLFIDWIMHGFSFKKSQKDTLCVLLFYFGAFVLSGSCIWIFIIFFIVIWFKKCVILSLGFLITRSILQAFYHFLSYTFIIISLTVYGSCGRDFSGDVGAFAVTTSRNRNTPDSCIVRINVTEGKLAIIRFKTIIMNCSTDFIEVWKNVEIQWFNVKIHLKFEKKL